MSGKSTDQKSTHRAIASLYRRPGFLIRRAHQIAVSIFLEEAAELGITTTQYGALVVLSAAENIDQIGLAKLVGIDRSTAALVVSKLEAAGLLVRENDPNDRRRSVLALTADGRQMLERLAKPAERAQERALSAFSKQEAKHFLELLGQFVDTFNEETRAPIVTLASNAPEEARPAPRRRRAGGGR